MEFRVRTSKLKLTSFRSVGIELSLRNASSTVDSIAKALRRESDSYGSIADSLEKSQSYLIREYKSIGNMRAALGQIYSEYNKTELLIKARNLFKPIDLSRIKYPTINPNLPGGITSWMWKPLIWPFNIGIGALLPGPIGISLINSSLWMKWKRWPFPLIGTYSSYLNTDTHAGAGFDNDLLGLSAEAGASASVFSAGSTIAIGGLFAEGRIDALKAEASAKAEAGLMRDGVIDPHIDAEAEASATLLSAGGAASLGLLKGEVDAKVGHVAAKGKVSGSLFDEKGELSPNLKAKASAEATAAQAKAKTSFGSDSNNIHAEAEGKVLTAGANAELEVSKDSIKAQVGAEAYVAKGSVSGGVTIFGIKIDAKASGGVGGASAVAGGEITGAKATGKIGLGLGVGAELELSVDLSDNPIYKGYQNFKRSWNALGKIFR